ncbi:A disintegrin and metalloproteinase with thrombospondin motifs 19-like [Rhipicephalus sanguineus]|uniref:A disintegrin and metalloproteinase with thrombospondin motifs 19-like n=1 Tax=Rhipicephalus sanguineus TaxID=34632 RepID=UPI001894D94C|nr:A disintegrin and metalloproteinase with thrombospondin motifs 19-like [Rhipicephalus sanguineus]
MLLHFFETSLLFCFASTLQDGEIVYPTVLVPRSNKGRKVLQISKNITLYLEKSQVFSSDFVFITESKDEKILHRMKREYYEKNLYHDEKIMASVIVDEDNGVQVEGVLSDTLRIRPMAQMERSEDGRIPHALYEITPPSWSRRGPGRHRKVNLRFGTIRTPRIRLRVVGITMWKKKPTYLVPGMEQDQILDIETLREFNKYYKGTIQFNNSDLMFLLTGLDMVFIEKNVTMTWVGGLANTGAICQGNKVAMAEDRPRAYINVQTVAHEIGHSLGCAHDGEPAIQQLPNHTSSETCPPSDGYIMSYSWKGENKYRFSKCCQQNIRNLVTHQPKWSCLIQVKLKKTISNNKDLPGMRTTEEYFCKKTYLFDYDAFYDKTYGVKDCKVRCQNKTDRFTVSAVDGTPCEEDTGTKKHCILGKCIEVKK